MFAEKTDLNLEFDLNETALVELNAADVEDVSGGWFWIPVFVAGVIVGYKLAKKK
ncbi:MAG: hypothetical protein ACK5JR_06865 [Tropicimonas sp.]|uniref:hypothetical protein n=1 Tax=Tropicimonas sp. TaxID=2067044 RepID=UPI003A83F8C2